MLHQSIRQVWRYFTVLYDIFFFYSGGPTDRQTHIPRAMPTCVAKNRTGARRPQSRPCSHDIMQVQKKNTYDNIYKGYTFIYLFQHVIVVMNNAKGTINIVGQEKKVLSVAMIDPVEATHYSRTYDSLKSISGEILRTSLEILLLCFMVKDVIFQAFKLYTPSLKQGFLFSLFLPGNMFHERSLKFS